MQVLKQFRLSAADVCSQQRESRSVQRICSGCVPIYYYCSNRLIAQLIYSTLSTLIFLSRAPHSYKSIALSQTLMLPVQNIQATTTLLHALHAAHCAFHAPHCASHAEIPFFHYIHFALQSFHIFVILFLQRDQRSAA